MSYYKWVNDAKVIKYSFKKKIIQFNEHSKWFQNKLKSKKLKCLFWN